MVNVNAPLPFNLNSTNHKRPRLGRLRTRSPQPSLDTDHQSVVSSASATASASALHELDEETHWPTLNVRIVRGGSALARGRPITRDVVVPEPETAGEREGETGASTLTAEQPVEAADAQPSTVCIRAFDNQLSLSQRD
jgi:hypothetical protein